VVSRFNALVTQEFDFIIAGLGAMGSAAAYHLSQRGGRVLGLDRFRPPHDFGSSHGRTRIIREAYFEHPLYVPLVQRAYQLWAELEENSGRKLFLQTGGLMIGRPDSVLFKGALRSAEQHGLEHEVLSAPEIRRRFPALQPEDDMVAVREPRAGVLFPEQGIQSHLDLALANGAVLKFDEPVQKWEAGRGLVRVTTATGEYTGRRLLIAAGAWTTGLLADLGLPLAVERQVLYWFEPRSRPESVQPGRLPIYILEYEPRGHFYGFPEMGDGVKVAMHHHGAVARPDALDREVKPGEIEAMRSLLQRYVPSVNGTLKSTAVCMYTNTPDEHFLLDFHPRFPEVLIASPCSGHGFKFSSVIGEIVARLFTDQTAGFDLSLFSMGRLQCAPKQ
jgi:sarcosine oxidase